jgi:hypothetical protein
MQRVLDSLRGYSDPAGYVDPQDGAHFERLELEREIPILARARSVFEQCRYPDGRLTPFHDTGAIFARYRHLQPPERSVSTLLPGVGHAWLGRGEGAEQSQIHLHFSGAYGHHHADNLCLALFAHGDELLPDLGYTHSRLRSWASSTLGHNTVLIDEQEQYTKGNDGPSDGRLLAWETTQPVVHWVEASAERAYPGLATLYRRAVMQVDTGDGDFYVVDLFRVEGGSQHDWVLHGNADYDSTATVSVPLSSSEPNLLPGVAVRLPRDEFDRGDAGGRNVHYGYVQNVSRGDVTDRAVVSFHPADSVRPQLRTHLPGSAGSTVYLGDAPSVRRGEENDALLDRFRMPVVLLRSSGPANLFAAVHEPFRSEAFIEDVSVQQAAKSARDPIVLSIRHHGVTDHIVHRMESGQFVVGQLQTDAEVAFVREKEGVPQIILQWGGTELRWGKHGLLGDGIYEGTVTGVLRSDDGAPCDALIVAEQLPAGDQLKGAAAIVTFGDGSTLGYLLQRIESEGGATRLVLDIEPGIAVTDQEARQLFFPGRTMPGPVTYRIRTSSAMLAADAPER